MNGYEALRQHAAWIDLSDRGKIRVTGEDRARLLHALATNDIQNLASQQTLYTFFLNEKGRVLADAFVHNLGDALWLDTEPELRGKLLEHLDRYLIADDVTLADETDTVAAIGVEGPEAHELAPKEDFAIPASMTGQPGVRVFVPASKKQEYIARLAQAAIPQASWQEANVVRLEKGTPRYGNDISDRFLVHETQLVEAVHPNKGCYLGQEIVERVRSQGQVHRLLMALHIVGNVAPASGAKLFSNDKEAGEITSAAYSPALGETVALGYVRREVLESGSDISLAGTAAPVAVGALQS
jgi:folate-binding protein YgfZ